MLHDDRDMLHDDRENHAEGRDMLFAVVGNAVIVVDLQLRGESCRLAFLPDGAARNGGGPRGIVG
eukprot:7305667-Pyramimonas_sp.AAC.1